MKALTNLLTIYRIQPENILDNMSIVKQLCSFLYIDEEKI